jgi:hypothetical protein
MLCRTDSVSLLLLLLPAAASSPHANCINGGGLEHTVGPHVGRNECHVGRHSIVGRKHGGYVGRTHHADFAGRNLSIVDASGAVAVRAICTKDRDIRA